MLIVKQEIRKAILAEFERTRPYLGITQVEGDVYRFINRRVAHMIASLVSDHAGRGKTFRMPISDSGMPPSNQLKRLVKRGSSG